MIATLGPNMKENFELPEYFEKHRAVLKDTIKECVDIHAEKASTGTFDSKFGGCPYFPKGMAYPLNQEGNPLKLLAQINFEQVPRLNNYPEKGILQFFLDPCDELYGCSFDENTEQKNFRIIYHEEIETDESKLLSDFSFVKVEEEMFPIESEAKLIFTKGTQIMPAGDFRFDSLIGADDKYEHYAELERYYELYGSLSHKIGGYPGFTQFDPREHYHKDRTELLLQVDSDDAIDIIWGDCGVANFFISEEDLKNKDFSKVLYNWDCS